MIKGFPAIHNVSEVRHALSYINPSKSLSTAKGVKKIQAGEGKGKKFLKMQNYNHNHNNCHHIHNHNRHHLNCNHNHNHLKPREYVWDLHEVLGGEKVPKPT